MVAPEGCQQHRIDRERENFVPHEWLHQLHGCKLSEICDDAMLLLDWKNAAKRKKRKESVITICGFVAFGRANTVALQPLSDMYHVRRYLMNRLRR